MAAGAAVAWAEEPAATVREPVPATGDVAEWVSEKVKAIEPSTAERSFDQIGWLTDLREAINLAGEHDRPVFLFTHDGRIALGRC